MAKYGWASAGMFSYKTKEATYGAAVTINSTNYFGHKGAQIKVEWPDMVSDDGDMITGYEFPTEQEILEADVRIIITEEKAHPAFVAAALALGCGQVTTVQDGIETAYRHKSTPMTAGSALPSINGVVKIGGGQYLYKGLFAESVKVSGQKGGYLSCELTLRGSGSRAVDATAFEAAPAESWLKVRNIRAWLESGADISISATPVQGAEDISSATPDALASRFRSFDFTWNNNPEKQLDNIGVDHGLRKAEMKLQLVYNDLTEINHYLNQDNLALEIDLDSGALVDPQGAYKYGLDLIIPRCRIKAAPLPPGGEKGMLLTDYEILLMEDGTNPLFQFYTYNAIAGLIA